MVDLYLAMEFPRLRILTRDTGPNRDLLDRGLGNRGRVRNGDYAVVCVAE